MVSRQAYSLRKFLSTCRSQSATPSLSQDIGDPSTDNGVHVRPAQIPSSELSAPRVSRRVSLLHTALSCILAFFDVGLQRRPNVQESPFAVSLQA